MKVGAMKPHSCTRSEHTHNPIDRQQHHQARVHVCVQFFKPLFVNVLACRIRKRVVPM